MSESNLAPAGERHPQLLSKRVKPTSKLAFLEFVTDGRLVGQRQAVYDLLKASGPLTGRELDAMLSSVSAHKRLSELERLGAVAVDCRRTCTISGLSLIHISEPTRPY